MNSVLPKQFLPLAGIPVIMHSINAFLAFDPDISLIIVLPSRLINTWEKLCIEHDFSVKHTVATGGATRFQSVSNGLALVNEVGLVGIHDAVRPLVATETIRNAYADAAKYGNAVPCLPVIESVRRVEEEKNSPVARNTLRVIQTPQVFSASLLKKAYRMAERDDFTDDATVLECIGEKIHLMKGNPENIKITHPADLLIAEVLLQSM
jgi:2-C-methyl-D-erythritol 4-phosphate cytidylyltransferase